MAEKNKVIKEEVKKKPNLKYQRDKDREIVKGIFKFYECPGAKMSFSYKKYKEDQVERFDLLDGEVYKIPLGVAKHLNTSGQYPIHQHLRDESGRVSQKIGKKVRRYGFQSLEFVDIEELSGSPSEIITVENV